MRHIDEDTITQAVIAHHARTPNARLRDLMTSLVQHLHAFAREVGLTEEEWLQGIEFLTDTGRMCNEERQEFVLLSDTLGLSTLVTAMNRRQASGCTEATASAPCHGEDAPRVGLGADLAEGAPGEPCYVRGQVRGPQGEPVPGAQVHVWQADATGSYDAPRAGGPAEHGVRGLLTSASDGGFHFRTVVAGGYPIPADGPVGRMLEALGRHPWRPAHLHFMIDAPGYRRLITHVFRNHDRYLDSDAMFGVRRSLIADWVEHPPGVAPDGSDSPVPFYTLDFDFVLERA